MSETELEESIQLIVEEADVDQFKRLDQFISHKIESMSRSTVKRLFEDDQIFATNDLKLELKKLPPLGTEVIVQIPPPMPSDALPENIPLEIFFEDEHLVIVNKPAGMVTHPAPGNYTGTLVNAILYHCPDLKGVGDQKRPGIVHRLDKGTSGVMVVAKNQICHEKLVKLFAAHDIDRVYEAIAMGVKMPIIGKLESTIGRHPSNRLRMSANVPRGKHAVTHYKILKSFQKFSHLEMRLETGRTHQIRVHLSSLLNSPILCDPVYGKPGEHLNRLSDDYKTLIAQYPHPFLHAKRLGFIHPMTGKELNFEVDPPKIFSDVLALAYRDLNE